MRLQIHVQPFCMELTEIRIHYVAVCHQTQPQLIFLSQTFHLNLQQELVTFFGAVPLRKCFSSFTLGKYAHAWESVAFLARGTCLLIPNDSHIYAETQRKQLKHLPDDVFFRLSTSLFLQPSLPSLPISFLEFCFLQQPLCC